MKAGIALIALAISAQAHAMDVIATGNMAEMMPPSAESQTLSTQLPPEVAAVKLDLSNPHAQGSMQFRTPSEGTTLADISISNVSQSTQVQAWPSSINSTGPVMIDYSSEASLYSFRLTHGLTESSALFVDAGVMKSKTDSYGSQLTRQGMRDFTLGYIGRGGSWIYGANFTGSPEGITKNTNSAGAFSGASTLALHGGYEWHKSRALTGVHFSYEGEISGSRKSSYFDGQNDLGSTAVIDGTAYYEYPIMKNVGFGVAAGMMAGTMNPFGDGTNGYHASAYSAFNVMDDTQIKIEAEGSSILYNTQDSGTNTRFTGVLSKAL